MNVWVCPSCHAEIPQEEKPTQCPLCGQSNRGFDEGFREDKPDVDKEDSKRYKEALKKLEEYSEGCEPEDIKHSCCAD